MILTLTGCVSVVLSLTETQPVSTVKKATEAMTPRRVVLKWERVMIKSVFFRRNNLAWPSSSSSDECNLSFVGGTTAVLAIKPSTTILVNI